MTAWRAHQRRTVWQSLAFRRCHQRAGRVIHRQRNSECRMIRVGRANQRAGITQDVAAEIGVGRELISSLRRGRRWRPPGA